MAMSPSPAMSLSLFLVLSASAIVGNTQRPARPLISPGSFPTRPGGDGNIRTRDFDLLEREARRLPVKSAQRNPLAPQLKEDFARIQIISRDVIAANLSTPTFDYKLIEINASEIKRRAVRLRSHLLFPGTEVKRQPPKETNRMEELSVKELMSMLDHSIFSFTQNPIFKNLEVLDVQNSGKAKWDLDRVILLSDLLRKQANNKIKQNQISKQEAR